MLIFEKVGLFEANYKFSIFALRCCSKRYSDMRLTSPTSWVCAPQGILHPDFNQNIALWHQQTPHSTSSTLKALELARNTRRQYASFISLDRCLRTRCRSAISLVRAQSGKSLATQFQNGAVQTEQALPSSSPMLKSTRSSYIVQSHGRIALCSGRSCVRS